MNNILEVLFIFWHERNILNNIVFSIKKVEKNKSVKFCKDVTCL